MIKKKDIVLIFDADLTLTTEYQQIPLFNAFLEQLMEKHEKLKMQFEPSAKYYLDNIIGTMSNIGGEMGLGYLHGFLKDIGPKQPFGKLKNEDLKFYGKFVRPAKGMREGLSLLKEKYKNEANIHMFIISVGIKPLIEGFVEGTKTQELFEGIYASEFFETSGYIDGIKSLVVPFGKTREVIKIAKGKDKLLDEMMMHKDYRFSYQDMILIGDSDTDRSKFSYINKQGGISFCVYDTSIPNRLKEIEEKVGERAKIIAPRDYNENGATFAQLSNEIEQIIEGHCDISPEIRYRLGKEGLLNPKEKETTISLIDSCSGCQNFYKKISITPFGSRLIRDNYQQVLERNG